MPRDRVGHLWVLHAKSVPRNGLWERRDLEFDAYEPRSLLPSRALNPFGGGARYRIRLDHRPLPTGGEWGMDRGRFQYRCAAGGNIGSVGTIFPPTGE